MAGLDAVFMIRCSSRDLTRWKKRAAELGYGGAAAWVRKVANDAIAAAAFVSPLVEEKKNP